MMSQIDVQMFRSVLLGFAAIAVLASVMEGLVLTALGKFFDWREAGASLLIAIGRRITDLVPLSIAMPGAAWLYEHRIWTVPLDTAWGWLALFLGLEFFYYWFHRASHRVRWFWATHAVHHSPNSFNLSAAYRLGWTGKVTGALIFFLPLVWVGFQPGVVLLAFAINLLYQFWIHAEWIPRLGVLEGIFNTPSAHRVHHASNLEYLDANYGGVLVIFDRLFGTYLPERRELPCRYGLVHPLRSLNPIRIAFFQWISLLADLRQARGVRAVIGLLFGPPGWAPSGEGNTTEDLRRRAGLVQATRNRIDELKSG